MELSCKDFLKVMCLCACVALNSWNKIPFPHLSMDYRASFSLFL